MATLEARILALEGGKRRGMCLTCEFVRLNAAAAQPDGPLLPAPATCRHPFTTLARELAGMPLDAPGTGGTSTEPAAAGGA